MAAEKLKSEYEHSILVEKKVYYLSTLRKRFVQIAMEGGSTDAETYRSSYFKKLLSDIWPEVSFISQIGKSDLVCSSTKTLGEAILEAKGFEEMAQTANDSAYDICEEIEDTDETLVHKAVGVLRRRILENNKKLEDEYYSLDEMSLSAQKYFVDHLLYKAVCWLAGNKYFKAASETFNKKCISISCDLTSLATSVPSPKHLGLAVHLYNEFGSRHLVDDMYCLGYSISYSELRFFLSSAANQAMKTQQITPSGGLVPENIVPREKGGQLIVGVADNWDHNERTVDGKRTTHAMTRTSDRTFDCHALPGGGLSSIIPYRKPSRRPSPDFNPPVTLDEIRPAMPQSAKVAYLKELLYVFGRCSVFCEDLSETQHLPPWNIFHAQQTYQRQTSNVSSIAYNPIIMASPTDYSTVYTTLIRTKEVMNVLGQSHAPVVFDMSLLAKALEIVWCKNEELHGVIPIEGGMHTLMSVFAGIGYLYADAGLRQLLTDSGLYAANTASNILAGKDFDRALTAFKLVDEALNIRLLMNFEVWCEENNKRIPNSVYTMMSQLREGSVETYSDADFKDMCDSLSNHLVPLMDEFRDECSQISPTFKLWNEYLTKVSLPLKLFILSTTSPNWSVHQFAKLKLMPLLFAANRSTYARYMTVQLLQMNRLPADIEEGFAQGLFTGKLSKTTFNNVWLDYTLEVTQNKALKGRGGIIGLTLKERALARWFLARPLSSRYSAEFHTSFCSTVEEEQEHSHHSNSASKQDKYDKGVKKLVTIFDGHFIDPFDIKKTPRNLINFATGVHATKEIESSMLDCIDRGRVLFETFVSERLASKPDGSNPPDKDFFSPMPRSNVKTMSDTKTKPSGKTKSLYKISGEVMFQRLLAMNSYKKVPTERVL